MERTDRTTQVIRFLIGSLAGALVVIVVAAIVTSATKASQIRDTQQSNSPTLAAIKSLAEQITDCTDPSGACYQRQRDAAAEQRGAINATSLAAAFCSVHHHAHTYRELLICVDHQLNGKPEAR